MLVWAATRARSGAGGDTLTLRHVAFAVVGLFLGLVVATADHRRLRVLAPAAYLASGAGLLLVLTPLGVTVNGSHSWIHIGGLSVQPLEFAKHQRASFTSPQRLQLRAKPTARRSADD